MTVRRISLGGLDDEERGQLLTGVGHTRFGEQRRHGVDVEAMREAWDRHRDELVEYFETTDDYGIKCYRKDYGRPFVERLLAGEERAVV